MHCTGLQDPEISFSSQILFNLINTDCSVKCRNCTRYWEHHIHEVTVPAIKKLTQFPNSLWACCDHIFFQRTCKKYLVDRNLEFHRTHFNNFQMMTQAILYNSCFVCTTESISAPSKNSILRNSLTKASHVRI